MIDVALTPAEMRPAAVAVVLDVLRATSTATQALRSGYRAVLCAASIDRAHELRGPGRVLAGERRCRKPPGFDLGNSPSAAIDGNGRELVLATTNGAPAIVAAAAAAPRVLLGCLLNLGAVAAALGDADDVLIVCAGTDRAVALEDAYCAGRLSVLLGGPRTDAALVAEGLVRAYSEPAAALWASADARRLVQCGLQGDIADCARESVFGVVPRIASSGDGVAFVIAEPVRTAVSVDPHATVTA
jgi:2-phosphosulfolactate phosphatase